jgi:hypothetical protein
MHAARVEINNQKTKTMIDTSTPKIKVEEKPNTQYLKEIAIYLEGYKKGRGDLSPLGEIHLKSLWDAIIYINRNL